MAWHTGDLQRNDAVRRSGWRDTTFPYCWGRRRRSAAGDRRSPRRSVRNRPPKAQDLFCRMTWPSRNPAPGGVRYSPCRQDLFCWMMWSCRTLCAVQRLGGRKVYAAAIEAGSQAAPSPGHAAALSQTGAFPRSRAPPSLRPCLRSRARTLPRRLDTTASWVGHRACASVPGPACPPGLNRTHARAAGARGCSTPTTTGCRLRVRTTSRRRSRNRTWRPCAGSTRSRFSGVVLVSASALPPRRRARGATSNRATSTSKPPAARMARDPSVPERQTCR